MRVFCILSDDRVFRSKSPALFSSVMVRLGIRGSYVPFMVKPEKLGQAIQSLRVLNMSGANITVPYKESVIQFLDELSEGARIIGAVNTIVCKGKLLKGYNTNAIGFMDALSARGIDVAGKTAIVFGTGGAAKAVVFILNWLRADSVLVVGRRQDKASDIVLRLGGEARSFESLSDGPVSADIVVNATSVSSPEEAPELAEWANRFDLASCDLVMDLNYGRSKNFWEDMARNKGFAFMNGLSALAYQARRTLGLWTGVQVDANEFLKAIEEV